MKTPEKRGSVTSSFYGISYIDMGIPIIGLGLAAQYKDVLWAVEPFIVILALLSVTNIAWMLAQRGKKTSSKSKGAGLSRES